MITDESIPMAAAPHTIAAALILLFVSLFAFLIDLRQGGRHDPSAESPSSELKTSGETPLLRPPLCAVGGKEGEKLRVENGRMMRTETRMEGGEDAVVCCMSELGGRDSPYPFSSYSSATQRKIKMEYDELVKSNQEKALTMAQVIPCFPPKVVLDFS